MQKTNMKQRTLLAAAWPLFLATSLTIPLFAQDYSQPQQGDPPSLVARIGRIHGDISFLPAGATDWSVGVDNYPITSGDRIYADQGAQAEIGAGSTDVRVWQNTDVTITNLTEQYEQIGLASGSIRVRIFGINPGATVEVDTPNGAAVITQPGDYRFDVFPGDGGGNGSSDAVVNAGALQITGPNGLNQEVTGGQAVQMTGSNPVELYPVNLPPFDTLDQWSIGLDHEILNSQSAQYVSRETPGYSDLDANGSWTPTPDYGPVWYPTNVAVGWRPYSAGHWAYVAPWGYTWIDDAPWGYAPFHYGRWAVIGGRWGWCPGPPAVRPVYSPALVAFVGGPGISIGISIGGGGGGVAAWFPLGVGEPFVPWYHASPAYARQVNVSNVNITNIHNTTIVNNYNTYITNTRTVNNVNQINTTNITYANRGQVTAVPQNAMSTGRPVTQAAVRLTPQQQQQFGAAPVHAAPSAPAPTHTLLAPRANVRAGVAAPTLITPRGTAQATPAANPARLAPVNLPKPQPATSLPKPVAGAVAGRPATAQPAAARAVMKTPAPAPKPATPATATRPATTDANPAPKPAARPAYSPETAKPYSEKTTPAATSSDTTQSHPETKPTTKPAPKPKPKKEPAPKPKEDEKPPSR